MQEVKYNGSKSIPELFDQEKMLARLKDPELKEFRVFLFKIGDKLNVEGLEYQVLGIRKNGNMTLKPTGNKIEEQAS